MKIKHFNLLWLHLSGYSEDQKSFNGLELFPKNHGFHNDEANKSSMFKLNVIISI